MIWRKRRFTSRAHHCPDPLCSGSGFSLLELLIAISLGVFLVLIMVQFLVQARVMSAEAEASRRMQAGARLALSFIADDVRQAGSSSCAGAEVLRGWEALGTDFGASIPPAKGIGLVSTAKNHWQAKQADAVLPVFNALPNSDILRSGLGQDNSRMVCSLAGEAEAVEDLAVLRDTFFYVARRGGKTANSPSLFRRRLSSDGSVSAAEEIIEGIENMQILYGMNLDNDHDNGVDSYLSANQIGDFSQVVSVRVSLLMQSVDYVGAITSPGYQFNDVHNARDGEVDEGEENALDGRLRRVFTTTIRLRN